MSAALPATPLGSVLLIEDQKAVATWARQTLIQQVGCRVDWAPTLAAARACLEAAPEPYFLAVADLNLPDADADGVLELLRTHKLPAIAVTGDFDKALRSKLLRQGLVDYVLKDSSHVYRYVASLVQRLWRNRSQSVLVVDDSPASRGLVASWLVRQGLRVHQAGDGQAALDCLSRDPAIRLVLTDRHMPGMDGFGLVKALRKLRGRDRLAIIGVSASEDQELSARFLKLGANDFLAKPFSYEELCARVHQNLDMLDSLDALRELASRDALTGLYNRRHFFAEGPVRLGTPPPPQEQHVALMLDVDHFKQVNDRRGHAAGDAVLRQMGSLLSQHFPDGLVARLGGEEFAVLLTGPLNDLYRRAELFREHFSQSEQHNPVDGQAFHCTVSVGASPCAGQDLDAWLRAADARLYEAKQGGRDRVVWGGA
ncbi:diguanylate cyclase [Inhella gelatinilytica]|uniref:diguanylate cyclase n=1 Tax=Inhella gelatinilytica TaxID=2795030 RepID=A0A931NFF7_9BURK|nr:diguanylate cyclase [Inhella gelatinilytica]MBH9554195.1 diguanylate cyclase [Inhella gelatinilytica]